MLRGCRQLGRRQLPIIGVNLGRLGFLTDLSPSEFRKGLPGLKRGQFQTVEHLMFECHHHRSDGTVITDLGLNEVNVTAAGAMKMLNIHLKIDDMDVTTYSCDGLIISTPVGSTAHNLSRRTDPPPRIAVFRDHTDLSAYVNRATNRRFCRTNI